MPFENGPYLSMAVLCEKVLREADGVISVIRIIDRIFHTVVSPQAPDAMSPISLQFFIVLNFKAGAARGRHTLSLRLEAPSGLIQQQGQVSVPLLFEAEDRGAGLIMNFNMQVEQEGLYWIHVLIGDELVTKIPLRVVYQRLATGSQPPAQP